LLAGGMGGLLAGLLGVGGGVVYVAILTYYFNKMQLNSVEHVRFILSNSFFAIFFSSIMGTVQQIRSKNFYLKEVLFASSTAVTSWVSVTLLIICFDWYSKTMFSIFFIFALFGFALKMFLTARKHNDEQYKDSLPLKVFPVVGVFTGIFSALSGLGGGVVTVPVLSDYLKLKIKKTTSISLGIIPFLSVASLILYSLNSPEQKVNATFGYLSPSLVIPMVIGGIITAPFGVKLSRKLNEKTIRISFVVLLLIVMVQMILSMI
jgi:uncharacterized protein